MRSWSRFVGSPRAPHQRAAALSPLAFAFIVAVSMAPEGPRTRGLRRQVSNNFAVAFSQAKKAFLYMSHASISFSPFDSPQSDSGGVTLKRLICDATVKSALGSFSWLVARATSPKHSNRKDTWRCVEVSPATGA